MTRSSLRRALRRIYWLLFVLLAVSLLAKISEHVAVLKAIGATAWLKDIYEFLRDMSLLIATGGVAYISNIYQRRQAFLDSLKAEWRDIINAKSALLQFMHKDAPSHEDYMRAYTCLSETIDNMRVVYRNVGETETLIGLYPYAPLHDMRRVLQSLNPKEPEAATADRKLVRDTMLRSFYALREEFLEELDLEEPDHPLLPSGTRRLSKTGATATAKALQRSQITANSKAATPETAASDALLSALYAKEAAKADR